ncbi:hypothetical protein C2G38_2201395 [Gigaspora rosea]|uniref:Uncharacterized protein n=1 Tax=Gigaspora rosea TaxID=44941 RepID=A0A397UXC0_9GLOM|nr:hypothetical protein C2G38_2201395 [Gigaspora rosea]
MRDDYSWYEVHLVSNSKYENVIVLNLSNILTLINGILQDFSESYTFLIEKKLYLQYSNNRKIEITSGINESYNSFNSNQQSIISASTPVYSVEGVSLPSPQQYVPSTQVTISNYDFSSASPFGSFTENSFCNLSDYETPPTELVNDNFQVQQLTDFFKERGFVDYQEARSLLNGKTFPEIINELKNQEEVIKNKSYYIMMPPRHEQPQLNAQDNHLTSSHGINYQ